VSLEPANEEGQLRLGPIRRIERKRSNDAPAPDEADEVTTAQPRQVHFSAMQDSASQGTRGRRASAGDERNDREAQPVWVPFRRWNIRRIECKGNNDAPARVTNVMTRKPNRYGCPFGGGISGDS